MFYLIGPRKAWCVVGLSYPILNLKALMGSLGCWIIGFSSVQFAHRIMGIGEFLHIAYPGGDYISLKNTMKEGGKKRKLQLLYQWLLIASFLFFYILLHIVINSS